MRGKLIPHHGAGDLSLFSNKFSVEQFSAEKLFDRKFFQPKRNSPSVSPKVEAIEGGLGGRESPRPSVLEIPPY